jgi:hypothetical protein
MELSAALHAKQEIFVALGLSYVRTRTEDEARFSVGIATPADPRSFRVAIRARSAEALERARLEGRLDAYGKYPQSELDVQVTGRVVAPPAPPGRIGKKHLAVGASVGHVLCSAGTLGFFARRTADDTLGFVSNNHVIAAEDEGEDGDDVLHPGIADGGNRELDVVAKLAGDYPRLDVDDLIVDCAFARLRDGISFDAATIHGDLRLKADPVPAELQRDVLKKGRSTDLTRGRISAFAMDHCDIEYDSGILIFNRQIEIASIGDQPFSKPGDSGSLVVSPDGHPVGLLAAATLDCRLHYANPIPDVLSSLGVTVLT